MPIETVALVDLSAVVVRLIAKLWLRDPNIAVDAATAVGELLEGRIPDKKERKAVTRTLERMADEVDALLEPFFDVEFGGLPENEKLAAIEAVKETAGKAKIDDSILLGVDLDPVRLEREMRACDPDAAARSFLNPAATLFYDRLLEEVAVAVIELGTTLPRFDARATAEILRREGQIIDLMKKVVENLPKARVALAPDPENFEIRYARAVASRLDRLELFGVTVSELSRRYRLSVAYITLSATATDSARERRRRDEAEHDAIVDRDDAPEPPGAIGATSDEALEQDGDLLLRIDDVLADSRSCLIRGEAGSGKTTLLQWLAVRCAARSHTGELTGWNDYVPFFLQLRRYATEDLPRPEQFLDIIAPELRALMPDGWVHAQLERGRALVLVDGVDELPARRRRDAHTWLANLRTSFPEARCVVTSRPAAVSQKWLSEDSFEVTELQPMEPADIVAFIDHWHDAAAADIEDGGERDELERHKARLKSAIRTSQPIRKLATLPLLCAMLCALNRDRKSKLPEDRLELYRIALETLLERRDIEREIPVDEPLTLSLREKELLLRDIAYWLMQNAQSDAEKAAAINRLSSKLELMPHVRASATETLTYLLERSGILRQPVEGRVDFIHRTFQEYLAAKQAVAGQDIGFLVKHAHEDNWREVIILAAGHADRHAREKLIKGLLARGRREPAHKHLMHLLAVACLETSNELSPEITQQLRDALADLVPPSTMTEARALASAGELAVPLLAEHRRKTVPVCAACIRTLALIGGDAALETLAKFGSDGRITVGRELLRAWRFFDPDAYARAVLANTPFPQGLVLPELAWLPTVKHLRLLTSLRIDGQNAVASDPVDLRELEGCEDTLTQLDVRFLRSVLHWEAIGDLDNLDTLQIGYCPGIQHLGFAGRLRSLTLLALSDLEDLEDIGPIDGLRQLEAIWLTNLDRLADLGRLRRSAARVLHVWNCPQIDSIEPIRTMRNLRDVSLRGISRVSDLDPLGKASRLETLNLYDFPDIESIEFVERLRRLHHLQLRHFLRIDTLDPLSGLTQLQSLSVLDCPSVRDAEAVVGLAGLRTLSLSLALMTDAPRLADMPQLTQLRLPRCESLTDLSSLAELRRLRSLTLLGCSRIMDLSPLSGMRSLTYLDLEGCVGLRDLTPIVRLPRLRTIDVHGCSTEIDIEPLLARGIHVVGQRSLVTV